MRSTNRVRAQHGDPFRLKYARLFRDVRIVVRVVAPRRLPGAIPSQRDAFVRLAIEALG